MAQPASATLPGRASKLPQLAGMLGKEPLFHRWLEKMRPREFHDVQEDQAANYIRSFCGVESRSQIAADNLAGEKFLDLFDRFVRWRDADQYVEA